MEEVCGITTMLSEPTRALSSPQLWSEDDRYHISTQTHWSLRVPDEHPCTIQSMHQHSVHSVLQTSTHEKKTHKSVKYDGPNTKIYIYSETITGRWMLHNCSCWNGKLCSRLFFFNQCSIQSFIFQNSWLQKYISVWEAHH